MMLFSADTLPFNFQPKAEGFAAIVLLKKRILSSADGMKNRKGYFAFIRSFDS
jgi:hypothetical protein